MRLYPSSGMLLPDSEGAGDVQLYFFTWMCLSHHIVILIADV